MTYEHAALLLALGFLAGVSIRPIRAALRSFLRTRRAAQPTRKRKKRKYRGPGIY